AYFGYAFIFGERGLLVWRQTQDDLQIAKHDPSELRANREALAHRIALLDGKAIDPDLLEEVPRGLLLENRPDEVAVPREKRSEFLRLSSALRRAIQPCHKRAAPQWCLRAVDEATG